MYDVEQQLRTALHEAAPEGWSVPLEPIARRARRRGTLRVAAATALVVAGTVTAVNLPLRDSGTAPAAGQPSAAGTAAPGQSAQEPTGASCVRGQDSSRTVVDYLDFVRIDGLQYRSTPGSVRPDRIGPVAGTVRCTLSVTLPGPDRVSQDGDSGFLPVGTELHTLQGYPPSYRLVAKAPGHGWVIFEVSDPSISRAERALPPPNAVVRIDIFDGKLAPAGRVTDPAKVRAVITGLRSTHVRPLHEPLDNESYLRFALADGTTSRPWAWSPTRALLDHAIALTVPPTVNSILIAASR